MPKKKSAMPENMVEKIEKTDAPDAPDTLAACKDMRAEPSDAASADPADAADSPEKLRVIRIERLCRLADKVVTRLEDAAVKLDSTDTQRLKHIVSAIKEIRDIQNLRTDSELREQELKLAELERRARDEALEDGEITVIIEGDEELCE